MKKTALIALILSLYCCVGHAQGPNQKRDDGICNEGNCMDAKFPYWFCDGKGNAFIKCSDDPNNEPGLKVLKRKIPIDFQYAYWTMDPEVTQGRDTVSFLVGDVMNYRSFPLFVGRNLKPIMEAAARRWMTDLCAPQGPDAEYQDCPVTVRWTYPGENIGDNFAVTNYKVNPFSCQVSCPTVEIVLNQNPGFTRRDDYQRPIRFIATERNNYEYLPRQPYEYIYMDAFSLMVHEFGHWLGFPHPEEGDHNGEKCGDQNGIMRAAAGNLEQQDLSWGDKCMFMKAYCCEDSKKDEDVTVIGDPRDPRWPPINNTKTVIAAPPVGFTVLPNPSRSGELTVRVMLPEAAGPGNIRVVDAAGKMMLEQPAGNVGEIVLDVSSLPKGVYMVQVIAGKLGFSKKVVIE